jgi:hypothetical protein
MTKSTVVSEPKTKADEVKITQEQRIENADIANGMADSTHDGGQRSDASRPLLVDETDEFYENPYRKRLI